MTHIFGQDFQDLNSNSHNIEVHFRIFDLDVFDMTCQSWLSNLTFDTAF